MTENVENNQISCWYWLMGGIIIGGGLFMLNNVICWLLSMFKSVIQSALGWLQFMCSIGVGIAGLALGLKLLVDHRWQGPNAESPISSNQTNQTLWSIYEIPENIVTWNVVLYTLLIVGLIQLVIYGIKVISGCWRWICCCLVGLILLLLAFVCNVQWPAPCNLFSFLNSERQNDQNDQNGQNSGWVWFMGVIIIIVGGLFMLKPVIQAAWSWFKSNVMSWIQAAWHWLHSKFMSWIQSAWSWIKSNVMSVIKSVLRWLRTKFWQALALVGLALGLKHVLDRMRQRPNEDPSAEDPCDPDSKDRTQCIQICLNLLMAILALLLSLLLWMVQAINDLTRKLQSLVKSSANGHVEQSIAHTDVVASTSTQHEISSGIFAHLCVFLCLDEISAPEPSPSQSAEEELLSMDPADRQTPWTGRVWTKLLEVGRWAFQKIFRTSSAVVEDDPPTSPTGQDLTPSSSDTQDSYGKASTPQDERPSLSSAPQKSPQISPPTSDTEDEDIVVSPSSQPKPSEMAGPEPSPSPSAEDELQSTDPRNCPSPLSDSIETEPVQKPLLDHDRTSSATGEDDPPTSPTGQDLTSVSSATQTDSSGMVSTPQDELPSMSTATQTSPQISPPTTDIEDEDHVVSTSTQHEPSVQNLHGLYNQGATCYLNSVLQVLFRTEDFRAAVERHNHGNCLDCRLQSLFDELKRRTGRTQSITSCLGITRVYEQQDAAEYLEKILSLSNPDVSQVFHGLLTNRTTCSSCGTETDSDGPFWNLPLALVDSDTELYSVVSGIEDFFREKHFKGENRVYCDSCHAKSNAFTKRVIKNHPEVLMLLLKRFTFDYKYMQYIKINSDVIIPDTLQIPENQTYELYAVVDHFGSLRGGHYTATINVNGEWYTFNDSRVTKTQQVNITSSSAYLLFYKKTKEMPAPEPSPSSRHSSGPKKFLTDLFKVGRWPFPTIFGSSPAIGKDDPPTSPSGQDLTSVPSDKQDSSEKVSTPQDELPSMSPATQKSPQISPPTSDTEDVDIVVSPPSQPKPSEMAAPKPSPSPSAEDELQSVDPRNCPSPLSDSIETEPVQTAPSSKENKTYQVIVNGLRGEELIIDLCNTEEQMQKMTVLQLKEKILQRLPGLDDVARLVLIFADKMLDGDSTLLCSYGIQHMSVIHVVIRLAQISSPTSDTEDEDSDASTSTQPEPSDCYARLLVCLFWSFLAWVLILILLLVRFSDEEVNQ
ncbi:uncharacterized protein V6R79_026270 [Siganus canaliculatus]